MRIRRPSVAGAFYPAKPDRLNQLIRASFLHKLGPGRLPRRATNERDILSVVCPHAGYVYSGPAAAYCYLNLAEQRKPDTVIILGPNHTGWGSPISIMGEGEWETPFGNVPIDEELAQEISNMSDLVDLDETAHIREHSIEVQLPFLQFIYNDLQLVPICMGNQDIESSIEIGRIIADTTQGKEIIIIASSDLTHQESKESANRKDRLVIEALMKLDERQLLEQVHINSISACGYGPISVAIVASKLLGAKKTELLTYYTSGDIIGDNNAVVGYAAAQIIK